MATSPRPRGERAVLAPKAYPRMPRVALPPPSPLPAADHEAIRRPRLGTVNVGHPSRTRASDDDVSIGTLSGLLHWAAGAGSALAAGVVPPPRPLELYVIARAVSGLPAGVFHWHPGRHALEALPTGADAVQTVYATLEDPAQRAARALIVVSARMAPALDADRRGDERAALMEAGARLRDLGVVAEALDVRGSAIGAAWDAEIVNALALDGDGEVVLAGFAVGAPAATEAVPATVMESRSPARGSPIADGYAAGRSPSDAVRRTTVAVPLDTMCDVLLGDSGGRVPGLAALRSAEQVLGVRLNAEVPRELLALPRDAWSCYPALKRLAETGLSPRCRWTRLEPDEPRFHACSVALGSRGHGFGIDARSPKQALDRAIGEAVERWVWREARPAPARLRRATAGDLAGQALTLDTLAGYAAALRARHPEQLAWTDATSFEWIEAESLVDGHRRWVPLQLVTPADAASAPGPREPELRPRVTTGLAAHRDRRTAILNGLLEVVERDAFMLTWLARRSGFALDLDPPAPSPLADLLERFRAARLRPSAVTLPTDVPVPVVLGVVHDPTGVGPALAIGAAARPDVADAAIAALTEAFASWRAVRRLRAGGRRAPASPAQVDRDGRVLWWAEPGRSEALRWLLAGPPMPVPAVASPDLDADTELARLLAWFRGAREDVLVVDLTDEALADRLGQHVVGVVVPGFHPLHLDEARPALWSARLERVVGARADTALNVWPHPFP
jgi:ribosomal protein S12 methylthiotransferase accessory factor